MEQPKKLRFYLWDEVVVHNKKDDCWVVIHKNVLDLTPMIRDRLDYWNTNMDYLVAHAGKDLTHLFHPNGEPRTEVSERSGAHRVLFPPILEVAISELVKTRHTIWSQDPMYHIGRVTRRSRLIRLINALTMTVQLMKVCDEDTIFDIQQKYKARYNHHAGSYEWRRGFSASVNSSCKFGCDHVCDHPDSCGPLNLNGTLDDNDLLDEEECDVELPPPAVWLYYTDDLTIA